MSSLIIRLADTGFDEIEIRQIVECLAIEKDIHCRKRIATQCQSQNYLSQLSKARTEDLDRQKDLDFCEGYVGDLSQTKKSKTISEKRLAKLDSKNV